MPAAAGTAPLRAPHRARAASETLGRLPKHTRQAEKQKKTQKRATKEEEKLDFWRDFWQYLALFFSSLLPSAVVGVAGRVAGTLRMREKRKPRTSIAREEGRCLFVALFHTVSFLLSFSVL